MELGEKIASQIVSAVKARKMQQKCHIAQLEFEWESHPCFVVVAEANGPVYVLDCADFNNPTSKEITIKKSDKNEISVLQMLQTPPGMKDRHLKLALDYSNIEYRFAQRLFMETKANLNFEIIGIHRLYNQMVQERFNLELKLMARKY